MQFLRMLENCRTAEDLAENMETELCRLTGADSAILYLKNQTSDTLYIIRSEKQQTKKEVEITPESLAGWCAYYAEPLFIQNPDQDNRFNPSIDQMESSPPKQLTFLPVRQSGGIFGVIRIVNPSILPEGETQEKINSYINSIPYAASSVVTGENLDNLITRFSEIISVMTDSVTPEGGGHTIRVAGLCSAIAKHLDLPAQTCRNLWNAAILHDLGKILMQGREPWETDRIHAEAGARYIQGISIFKKLAGLIRTSHARYDGTGIPSDVAGDDIPLENWILALAEDMEEFFHINRYELFEDTLNYFFVQKAESHHPLAMEAAQVLAGSGKLEGIIRG